MRLDMMRPWCAARRVLAASRLLSKPTRRRLAASGSVRTWLTLLPRVSSGGDRTGACDETHSSAADRAESGTVYECEAVETNKSSAGAGESEH